MIQRPHERTGILRACIALAAVAGLATSATASAQGVRGTATSTVRYAEIRPMRRDTVDSAQVTIGANGAPQFEGHAVQCAGPFCSFFVPADPESALLFSEDVALTAWGLGVEGLSATVHLRARSRLAGTFDWPRYDDPFDAMLAYAELVRDRYRVRLGRQSNISGLGFTLFDGLAGRYDATTNIRVEAFAGRSLGRGIESPRHSALEAIEDFLPDEQAYLMGAASDFDAGRGINGAVRVQSEFWGDGSGLISERASLDLRATQLGPVEAELSADYDMAFGQLGKAFVTVRYPMQAHHLTLEATARRYRPFFEYWTIWGFFSPVGFNEAELQAVWRASSSIDLSAQVALRKYEETSAQAFLIEPKDKTGRLTIRSRFRPAASPFTFDAEYRLEQGFGALLNSFELNTAWSVNDRMHLGAYATAFQQILEFRTGDARVLGIGATGDVTLTDRMSVSAGATIYHQNITNRPSAADWNQKRGWLSLDYTFGRDPGMGEGR